MAELRAAGSVLVAVFACMLGFSLQRDLKKRIELLQEFHRGLRLLCQEIRYMKAPLEEAALHVGRLLQEPFASFFTETGKKLEAAPGSSFFRVWEEMQDRYLSELPLRREDLELIRQIGRQLEELTPGENGDFLKIFEQRLEERTEEARKEYAGKAQLYGRLGIVGGLFLVIIFL